MKHLRKRLTYANVMSSIAVFLVLGGATAFAASQLGKNSVGTKQLKKNAVTTAKIKKNAITGAKIKPGAVNGAKIADGSITGTEIAAGSTPFSQAVARLRLSGPVPLDTEGLYPLGSYTQPAGETDQWVPGMTVSWAPGCAAPRSAFAYLIHNPVDPGDVEEGDVIAYGVAIDEIGASGTTEMFFAPFEEAFYRLSSIAPSAPANHTFYVYTGSVSCDTGDGATLSSAGVDVIGTK